MTHEDAIKNINRLSTYKQPERRRDILAKEIGVPLDESADYVVLSGCLPPFNSPGIFHSLKHILEYYGIRYTFLSKEFCCGFLPLLQPAIIAKDYLLLNDLKEVTNTFLWKNVEQAKSLGCKGVVIVCAPCEASYSNIRNNAGIKVLHYDEFLSSIFEGGKLDRSVDYYGGCMTFRRGISTVPFNSSALQIILNKIAGLEVKSIDNTLCCFVRSQMEKIIETITTDYVVASCTGCRDKLEQKIGSKECREVGFLTEVMWESLKK